ncbi:MAG: hypothetical protein HC895_04010 [Leptolyngbyaceae cyanobacterium SM1_3_5]|nr:hypothetical protein [Leptolyngbyaceae cyanobacterium SM1_3_5]
MQEQQFRSQLDRTGRRFSAQQLLTQNRSKTVLLGAPGSGKTTLMSYFAVTLAREAIAKATSANAEALQANPKASQANLKASQANPKALPPHIKVLQVDTERLQTDTKGLRSDAEGLQADTKELLLPILIRIRDWALHPEMSIADFAKFHAEKTMSVKPLPAGFFEYWLDRGQALILLDGLDEVADETKRSKLVQCIENFWDSIG